MEKNEEISDDLMKSLLAGALALAFLPVFLEAMDWMQDFHEMWEQMSAIREFPDFAMDWR